MVNAFVTFPKQAALACKQASSLPFVVTLAYFLHTAVVQQNIVREDSLSRQAQVHPFVCMRQTKWRPAEKTTEFSVPQCYRPCCYSRSFFLLVRNKQKACLKAAKCSVLFFDKTCNRNSLQVNRWIARDMSSLGSIALLLLALKLLLHLSKQLRFPEMRTGSTPSRQPWGRQTITEIHHCNLSSGHKSSPRRGRDNSMVCSMTCRCYVSQAKSSFSINLFTAVSAVFLETWNVRCQWGRKSADVRFQNCEVIFLPTCQKLPQRNMNLVTYTARRQE